MKTLKDIVSNPSGLDSYANYMGEIPSNEQLVVLTTSRDADRLTRSNWETALEMLGGESGTVQIDRFGHWACGWWEALSVKQGSEAEKIALEIEQSIEDYPVLNDEHFAELETKEANEIWESCYDASERVEYVRENKDQFCFSSFADLIGCIRGKYFAGHVSELIY